ncbi:hypothetical protein HKX48_004012 [Thoreauomyces humboldtii]|nr:hypothetical protein HKX48_004012 [Thoreauomyces humboldtii]
MHRRTDSHLSPLTSHGDDDDDGGGGRGRAGSCSPVGSDLHALFSRSSHLTNLGLASISLPPHHLASTTTRGTRTLNQNDTTDRGSRILGGNDPTSTILSLVTTLTTLTGTSPAQVGTHLHTLLRSSPHTSLQIILGLGLHVTHLVGLTPYRGILFHPRLLLAPRWQLWRGFTGFGVLGLNVVDVVKSAVGMLYWQAPLERWFDGEGDVVKHGIVVREGRNRTRRDGTRKTVLEWLVLDNRYLRAQILSGLVLVGIELVIYKAPIGVTLGGGGGGGAAGGLMSASSLLLFPYSLYPSMEHALRWLWAITTPTNTMTVFGVLPVRPVYLPLALCALGAFAAWKEMLKGLVAAVVVGKIMDLRRDDGENAVDWLYDTATSWVDWAQRAAGRTGAVRAGVVEPTPTPRSTVDAVRGFFAPTVLGDANDGAGRREERSRGNRYREHELAGIRLVELDG